MTAPLLYTTTEAAELLKVSKVWLQKATAARAVPFRRLGRTVRFSEDDLRQIVATASERPVNSARMRRVS